MGLFGLNNREEMEHLLRNQNAMNDKYDRRLQQYSKTLESYHVKLQQVQGIIDEYEAAEHADQMEAVQTALDLKYLKEQGEQFQNQINQMATMTLPRLQKDLDSQKNVLSDLKQQGEQTRRQLEEYSNRLRSVRKMSRFCMILMLISIAALVFLILNQVGVIIF